MTTLEKIADTFFEPPRKTDFTAYGRVASVNADGSYQVQLNSSATTTRCTKLCEASVDDSVMVIVQANGHAAAVGKVGTEPYQSLQRGTAIAASTDLDTLTAFGRYHCGLSATAATLSNCPVSVAFSMTVEAAFGQSDGATNYIVQRIKRYDNGREYWRYKSTSWGSWFYEAERTTDSQTANTFLAAPDGAAGIPSYRAMTNADMQASVDSETTIGNIITQTSTQSTNYPVTSATYKSWGRMAMLNLIVTPASNVAVDTGVTLGTIASGKRPATTAGGSTNRIMSMLDASGTLYFRPRSALTANTSYNVCLTYILA